MQVRIFQWVIALCVSALAAIAICAHYVNIEHPAYMWDYANYWNYFQSYGSAFMQSPMLVAKAWISRIRVDDYNPSPILPLLPFYVFFGGGRTSYIAAIVLTYLIPTALVAASVSAIVARASLTIAIFAICLTFPPFWQAVLRGEPDIIGTLFLALATLLLLRSDFLARSPIGYGVAIGAALYAPFLLRRWYAYSIVLFFISAFFVGLAKRIHSRADIRSMMIPVLGLVVAGVTSTALALSLQFEFVKKISEISYGDIYSAYQVPFKTHLLMLAGRASIYTWIPIAVGVIIAIYQRNFEAIFCLFAAVGTFFFFIQTQYLGIHHSLPIFFWFTPLMIIGLNWIARKIGSNLIPFAAVSGAALLLAITPGSSALTSVLGIFVPSENMRPLHLDNFDHYLELTRNLDEQIKTGGKVAIFSSSPNLSDSLLLAIDSKLASAIILAPHIAATQGFPLGLLDVDFAVTATPDQTHQAPGAQDNLMVPGHWIMQGKGFGQAFERMGEYKLQGATAYLYRRVRDVTPDEKTQLMDELAKHYPGLPNLFPSSGKQWP